MIVTISLAGCLQCQVAADKPAQLDGTNPASPDISMSPELQQQWHVDQNMHFGAKTVGPQSHIKAVWQCNKCPAGQPHQWLATVGSRTQGANCPYCSNQRVCLHNCLATIAPNVARYWNYSKNKEHQRLCVLTAVLRLSGSAQLASMNGRRSSLGARNRGLAVPYAVVRTEARCDPSQHSQGLSLPALLSGTISAPKQRAAIQVM